MAQNVKPAQLDPRTLQAFEEYLLQAELEWDESLCGQAPFLWSDAQKERTDAVRRGDVVAQFWSGHGPVKVPSGLIHDWIAAAFIPDSRIRKILAVIQDYDNHKNIYQPEVIESRLIRRNGNDFQIYLRLLKKKIITVVL